MTPELKSIIEAARELTPLEQLELLSAVSGFLQFSYQQSASYGDFWRPKPLDVLAQEQNGKPIKRIADLVVDYWPAQESADDIIDYLYEQRQEDQQA